MADRQGDNLALFVASHLKKGSSLRRAQPLVAVTGVVGGVERPQVERNHSRRAGPVDQAVDAEQTQLGHQPLHREDHRRNAGDVVQHRQARSLCNAAQHAVHRHAFRTDGERQPRHHHFGSPTLGGVIQAVSASCVGVVGGQQLVAGGEPQRAQNDVHSSRRVRDENEVLRIGTDKAGQGLSSLVQQRFELSNEKADRFALQLIAIFSLRLEDRQWAGPE